MIPFIGLAPDADSTLAGVITECDNVIPTLRGMAGAPTARDVGADALPSACRGAAVLSRLNQQRRVFAGTQTGMYELSGMSFTDRSRAGGYTGSTENRWRFAQFGNASLACNETEPIQLSTAIGTSFADIATSPKARYIETASGFVLAFGLNSAYVGGDRPDAWACSNIYDHLTWTPGASNQAAFGYLLDTSGDIRGAKRIGKNVVAYKERSMYLGTYVGPPVIWQWDLVASNVGAISNEAVIDTGTAHLFIGRDDFWIFDGSRPRPIGAPIKEWFFTNSDSTYRYNIRSYFDQFKNVAWWFYPVPGSGGALTDAVVYNLNNDRWGHVTLGIQTVFMYQGAETTYDNWPPGPDVTFDNIVDLPFDSLAFDTDSVALGIFGNDSKIKTLTGPCVSASITTGDIGQEGVFTTLAKVVPAFKVRPSASTMTQFTRDFEGDSLADRGSSALFGEKYDAGASGRFHRLKITLAGDFEIVGVAPELIPDGQA